MPLRAKVFFVLFLSLSALIFAQGEQSLIQNSNDPFIEFQKAQDSEGKFKLFVNGNNLYENSSAYDWLETVNVYLSGAEKTKDSTSIRRYKTIKAELYFYLKDYSRSLVLANEVYEGRDRLDRENLEVLLNTMDKNYQALKMYDKQIEIRTVKRLNGFAKKSNSTMCIQKWDYIEEP